MEWDATVELTPLQIQEGQDAQNVDNLQDSGYGTAAVVQPTIEFAPMKRPHLCRWDPAKGTDKLAPGTTKFALVFQDSKDLRYDMAWNLDGADPAAGLVGKELQISTFSPWWGYHYAAPSSEIVQITAIDNVSQTINGMI